LVAGMLRAGIRLGALELCTPGRMRHADRRHRRRLWRAERGSSWRAAGRWRLAARRA